MAGPGAPGVFQVEVVGGHLAADDVRADGGQTGVEVDQLVLGPGRRNQIQLEAGDHLGDDRCGDLGLLGDGIDSLLGFRVGGRDTGLHLIEDCPDRLRVGIRDLLRHDQSGHGELRLPAGHLRPDLLEIGRALQDFALLLGLGQADAGGVLGKDRELGVAGQEVG